MMKITENNIQKIAKRVHSLRQQWLCRTKMKYVVHKPASVTFFTLSVLCSYSLLSLFLLSDFQFGNMGFVKYLDKAGEFLNGIFFVPGKPVLSVLTTFLGLYAVSFFVALVVAIVFSVNFEKEPIKKVNGLRHSEVSSMATGVKIYQEVINPREGFHGKLNSILSLAFSLILTGLVAYIFAINKMFADHWERFLGWAIWGTVGSWIAHRLLLGLLSFPVALLYCFPTPAPGLKKALEKKAEKLKPTYKYADRPKTTVSNSGHSASSGTIDYDRVQARTEEILRRQGVLPANKPRYDLYDPDIRVDVSDM